MPRPDETLPTTWTQSSSWITTQPLSFSEYMERLDRLRDTRSGVFHPSYPYASSFTVPENQSILTGPVPDQPTSSQSEVTGDPAMPIPETPVPPESESLVCGVDYGSDDSDEFEEDEEFDEEDGDEDLNLEEPEEAEPEPGVEYCDRCDEVLDECSCPRCPACDQLLSDSGICFTCRPRNRTTSSFRATTADSYAEINPPGSFDAARWIRRSNGNLVCQLCNYTVVRPTDRCQCCRRCNAVPCRCCRNCQAHPCTCIPLEQVVAPAPELSVYQGMGEILPEQFVGRDSREGKSCNVEQLRFPLTFFPARNQPLPTALRTTGPRRYVAVEIEVGGLLKPAQAWRVRQACEKWFCPVVADASLPSTGFEINTSPAKGKLFVDQITEICKALRTAGAWVNIKCGLHVHVDSLDLSAAQILRLIELYGKIEDGLFLTVPDSRRRNGEYRQDRREYCGKCSRKLLNAIKTYQANPDRYIYWGVPDHKGGKKLAELKRKRRTRKLAHLAVYEGVGQRAIRSSAVNPAYENEKGVHADRASGQLIQNVLREHYAEAKYYALNLHSHFYSPSYLRRTEIVTRQGRQARVSKDQKRGTIECRLAAGTTDPAKIIPWAMLWDQILHAATGWPTDRINALPGDSWEALLVVAGEVPGLVKWLTERRAKFADHKAPPAEDF